MKKLFLLLVVLLTCAFAQTFKTPLINPLLCPNSPRPSAETDGYTLVYRFSGNCWVMAPAGIVQPPIQASGYTFAYDDTISAFNPNRGLSLDYSADGEEILWWVPDSLTPRRATQAIYKLDYNLCDGQASATACETMVAPTSSVINNLPVVCDRFVSAGYSLSIKFVWYYGGYRNPNVVTFQNVISAMTNSMRTCEYATFMHMFGIGIYSEHWGNYLLTAGTHNGFSYTAASAVRLAYDNALLYTEGCWRRPDYLESTISAYPITDLSQVFSRTGSGSTCQQNDAPISTPTDAGTYGVNGNNGTQQLQDDKDHALYTIKTGEAWEKGFSDASRIGGDNTANFNTVTQYFDSGHWDHLRAFSGEGQLCGNPCRTTNGQMVNFTNGSGLTLGSWFEKYLGYRIYLARANIPTGITLSTPFSWSLSFGNAGTAPIKHGTLVQLVLKSGGGTLYRYPIWNTPHQAGWTLNNPRAWLPDVVSTASGQYTIPGGSLTPGTYTVGLAFPRPFAELQTAARLPLFSIRLANHPAPPGGGNGAVTWNGGSGEGVNYLLKSDGSPVTVTITN